MMKMLLLICALGTPHADCSMATAEALIQGPDAMSLVQCGLNGQAYIAHGAVAGYLDGEHYLKITCTLGPRLHAPTIQPIRSVKPAPSTAQATD